MHSVNVEYKCQLLKLELEAAMDIRCLQIPFLTLAHNNNNNNNNFQSFIERRLHLLTKGPSQS